MPKSKSIFTYSALLLLGLAASLMSSGCNVITPVAYAIHGPQKILPVYTLEEHASTVIFVDDPSSKIALRRLRLSIAQTATSTLLKKRVLTDMIDPRGILTAASKERHGDRMSITELGKAVGAEYVIYAVVTEFTLFPEAGSYTPTATMRMKVIEVATGERVWPENEFGNQFKISIPQLPSTTGMDSSKRLKIESELATRSGLGLAQMFYKHEITETVITQR
ncbi:MAG: hypothetical protein JKY96_03505 [Phycisphaerales bacterium]|nr:hypothetical protein [Phycisphaerales bacterium]